MTEKLTKPRKTRDKLDHSAEVGLKPDAIAATIKLAEALGRSHPAEAQAALKKVLASTEDEAIRQRVESLLQRMAQGG